MLSGCQVCDWGIQYHLCNTHIEGCEGWWSSGCCGSVAENWLHKPEVSWVQLPATATFLTFLYFRLITSKFFVISKTMPEFNYYNPEVHDAMSCYCKHVVHAMINTNVKWWEYLITNPRILNQQGILDTCMLPVEAFVTMIKIFKRQNVSLQ